MGIQVTESTSTEQIEQFFISFPPIKSDRTWNFSDEILVWIATV